MMLGLIWIKMLAFGVPVFISKVWGSSNTSLFSELFSKCDGRFPEIGGKRLEWELANFMEME
jgi:hypothetical protein